MDEEKEAELVKLIVIGDQSVGKSSLIIRFTDEIFGENTMSTIGIAFRKKVCVIDNQETKVTIFDTAGHERYRQITKYFYHGCKGIIIVCDVNVRSTFESVENWIQGLSIIDTEVDILLIGNKIDLERNVSSDELKIVAKEHKILFMETSAKTGENVDRAFELILKKINERKFLKNSKTMESTIALSDKTSNDKKSKCCF
jgi:small GTP-binding protein